MVKILASVLMLAALSVAAPASAASQTSTLERVYVSNQALSIHVDSHPAGCPWGIIATEQDAAYDRWISLAMLAYRDGTPVTVEYDATTCKLNSLALELQ
jgi:hypothetical protein